MSSLLAASRAHCSMSRVSRIAMPGARMASSSVPPLKNQSLWRLEGHINGQWTKGTATGSFEVKNPGTAQSLGHVADMKVQDVQEAIRVAKSTFETWGKTKEYERSALLKKLFEIMQANSEDIAQIITAENGKALVEAKAEVSYGSSFIDWFAGEAIRNYGEVIPSPLPGVQNFTIRQPVGVAGIITPWNFPYAMVTRKLGAALAAGCTTVLKAPAETPFSVLAIAAMVKEAGFPDGVVNVVPSHSHTSDIGREICESPDVDKVSFTGSTRVGKILMKQSASTLKKLSLELGGNAPFIVFDDAQIDKAIQGAIVSKFRQMGTTCICANRIFVQDGIYDEFSGRLVEAVRNFKVGLGTDKGVTHGPLIHESAIEKVEQHITDATSRGAKLLTGGERMKELPGYFFEPTVLAEVPGGTIIDDEETFGPVAPLYRFKTEEEVIKLANEPRVGLAGYIFSENAGRVARVSSALHVGMVGANTGAISQACIPFGGVGESGFGREGSAHGMQEYQNMKAIVLGGI